jgi:hypothetical protein
LVRTAIGTSPISGESADCRSRSYDGASFLIDEIHDADHPQLIRETIDEMSGLIEHAGLDTRLAWVRDARRTPPGSCSGALGVVLLLGRLDGVNLDWVIPAAIVVLGVLLIVLARSIARRRQDEPTEA